MLNFKFKDIQGMQANTQKGMTLIELLIAAALGILVIMGASRAMLAMNASSKIQAEKNDLGQTAEIAFAYIGQQLRNSLAAPCERFQHASSKNKLSVHDLSGLGDADGELTGTKAQALINGHGISVEKTEVAIGTNPASHTDNLLMFTTGKSVRISGNTDVVSPTVIVPMSVNPFAARERLFVLSTCDNIDVFKIASAPAVDSTSRTVTFTPELGGAGQLSINYRAIDAANLSSLSVSKISVENRTLKARILDESTTERTLLNHIESMRVIFGVDAVGQDGVIDKYITANELAGLRSTEQLVSVELYLLVAASDVSNDVGNIDMPDTYTIDLPNTAQNFGGGVVSERLTFNDKVLRKVFKQTITLRNTAGI